LSYQRKQKYNTLKIKVMKVRVSYRVECTIEADDIKRAKEIFESADVVPMDTPEAEFYFVEIMSVEDGDTLKDIESEWYKS